MLLAACALDLGGLGVDPKGGETGADARPLDSATLSDQLSADDAEAPDDVEQESATSGKDATPGADVVASDAPAEASGSCDEDSDGYISVTCGGNDCCDHDPHVHPGQTSFFTSPGACGGYDYDCDGKDTPEYGAANCQWSAFSCSGDGFAAPTPSCGDFGTFTTCNIPWYDVLTCAGANASKAQGCR